MRQTQTLKGVLVFEIRKRMDLVANGAETVYFFRVDGRPHYTSTATHLEENPGLNVLFLPQHPVTNP
jgi:hypothetical protein